MAGELQATYATGSTLYAILRNGAGAVYNGSTFDATPTTGEWTTYDIAMTEDASTGLYRGTMPAVAAGAYAFDVRLQAGGSPAATDRVVGQGAILWNGAADSLDRLARSAGQIVPGTVDTTAFTPTTTQFEADDITEATASHYVDRMVLWTSGALAGQVTGVTAYTLAGGRGHFTVEAMTEAAADNDTFVLV